MAVVFRTLLLGQSILESNAGGNETRLGANDEFTSNLDAITDSSVIVHQCRSASKTRRCPSLYQINTRVLLRNLTEKLKRTSTLDDIPDQTIDHLAQQGVDWVWFLGVWQTGPAGRNVSREQPDWQKEFRGVLPDCTEEDVCGSCFAVTNYVANCEFGGNAALDRLRERVHQRGMKLLLDFIPNHTALDHPWIQEHPEYYVRGTQELLQSQPQNYVSLPVCGKPRVLAYGRDPYFPGWPDTLQLNYAEPALQKAIQHELHEIAKHCDGVRCDMAMLVLPEVFERTWGRKPDPFWPAAIMSVRSQKPNFLFMAEVYWDLEWTLQQQGFDYTYDKRLYDRLREGHVRSVRDHLCADMAFQMKSARFLENHDEPRAAATFSLEQHRAAAIVTFLCPGLRFFHDGQFEGKTKRISVHLGRGPEEPLHSTLLEFYEHLLAIVNLPSVRDGAWRLLQSAPAWETNWTSDCFICFIWEKAGEDMLLVAVNYAPNRSQCYIRLPLNDVAGESVLLQDLMGHLCFARDRLELCSGGLYLDLSGWGYHVFRMTKPDLAELVL